MTEQKALFVEYCADDFLGGTVNMEAATELAYRRICDMIYATRDNLVDNASLKYATKAGAKWQKIRQELIDLGKIYVENGIIRQSTCSEKIAKARRNIDQKSHAGSESAKARKSLKEQETGSTAVSTAVPTAGPTNQEPNNQERKNTPLPPDGSKPFQRGTGVLKSQGGRTTAAPSAGLSPPPASRTPFRIEPHLSDDDLAEMREAAPGWDKYNLMRIYDEGVPERGVPKHPAKAFLAWCRAYTKGKSP